MQRYFRRFAAAFVTAVLLGACAQAGPAACVTGGCSGQLCFEQGRNVASTCEWAEHYRCYRAVGKCERQPDGTCGWTPTDELSQCLTNANRRPPFLPPSAP